MLVTSGLRKGRCPLCGEPHATCGQPSDSVPIDQRLKEGVVAGPLTKYEVTMPNGTKTVMKLNEADAERYAKTEGVAVAGFTPVQAAAAPDLEQPVQEDADMDPAAEDETEEEADAEGPEEVEDEQKPDPDDNAASKARQPANMARSAQNKGRRRGSARNTR